jgi:hypothetical protein
MILILSPGRSGSSMVAGLFAQHGAWVGQSLPGNSHNPKGYFENGRIKRRMIKLHGRDWPGPFPKMHGSWPSQVKRVLRSEGYEDGPWFFKTRAFYWHVWKQWEPVVVKVWRDREDIFDSYNRASFLTGRYTEAGVALMVDRQHDLMRKINGFDIQAQRLIDGDYDHIRPAINFCGLGYDRDKCREFIEPAHWRFQAGERLSMAQG